MHPLLISSLLLLALPLQTASAATSTPPTNLGRAAATAHCTQCHMLPEPEQLDRRTWEQELLPKMARILGLVPPTTNWFPDLELLQNKNYFPTTPKVPADAWKQITNYYIQAAPVKLPTGPPQSRIQVGLPFFEARPAPHRVAPTLTTVAAIDPTQGVILFGDAAKQALHVLTPEGRSISSFPLANIPVCITDTPKALWIAAIGHFFPSDEPRGQILRLTKTDKGLVRDDILSNLPRPTDVQVADLNGDGKDDLAVCAYGNYLGRFSWFEQTGTNQFKEHLLLDKPGSIRSAIRDLNQDGHPDILLLVAQAEESMFAFIGDGKGGFTQHRLFQRPPSWGHSGFETVDLNDDGRLDLLVTNGDNADFTTSPLKPYHGIRSYLNKGDLRFEESFFFQLNGAYGAVARDFDQDGDLDIAAISFFPDYTNGPRESFVFLRNDGENRYTPLTFKECISGRWLRLTSGDIDDDGDEDLILGSLTQMPTEVPAPLKTLWTNSSPSLMILRNTLRRPTPSTPIIVR